MEPAPPCRRVGPSVARRRLCGIGLHVVRSLRKSSLLCEVGGLATPSDMRKAPREDPALPRSPGADRECAGWARPRVSCVHVQREGLPFPTEILRSAHRRWCTSKGLRARLPQNDTGSGKQHLYGYRGTEEQRNQDDNSARVLCLTLFLCTIILFSACRRGAPSITPET